MLKTKRCNKCGEIKLLDEFYKNKKKKDGRGSWCKECYKEYRKKHREETKEYNKEYQEEHREDLKEYKKDWYEKIGREKKGSKSMYEDKSSSQWLGIVIGERLCRHLFKDVEVMPNNNPGYDIICNKGKKINVKTACITLDRENIHWQFHIKYNKIADFFILVAFDNRIDLNPLYIWMFPGKEINYRGSISMYPSTIHKWDEHKIDIKDAQLCCAEMKK